MITKKRVFAFGFIGILTTYYYFNPLIERNASAAETREISSIQNSEAHDHLVYRPSSSTTSPQDYSTTGTPNIEMTEHKDHPPDCMQSMIHSRNWFPDSLPPMTEEEVLESLMADERSLALLDEFESTVVLPDGNIVLRSQVAEEFENEINELMQNE